MQYFSKVVICILSIWSQMALARPFVINHGILDTDGFWILQPKPQKYMGCPVDSEGWVVYNENGKMWMFNIFTKKNIGNTVYPFCSIVNNQGFKRHAASTGEGRIDRNANWLIPPRFNYLSHIGANGLLFAVQGKKRGYVNRKGVWQFLIKSNMDCRTFGANGLAPCVVNDDYLNWQYINDRGELLPMKGFSALSPFSSNGLALARVGGKFGYINKQLQFVIKPQFEEAFEFTQFGTALAGTSEKLGIINQSGEWVVAPKFKTYRNYSDTGFLYSETSDGWGVFDTQGKQVSPVDSINHLMYTFGEMDVLAIKTVKDGLTVIEYVDIRSNTIFATRRFNEKNEWLVNAQGKVLMICPRLEKESEDFEQEVDRWHIETCKFNS